MRTDPRLKRREEGRARLLKSALERYRQGERIELAGLAVEIGVGRTSAYRWFGDNDRLLAEVMMVRARENFETQRQANLDKRGRDRVLAIVHGFVHHGLSSENFQELLLRDPERMLRIVASGAYGVQRMVVGLYEGLLVEESTAGHLELPVDAHTLAYAIVRLIEAFMYADTVAGEEQDVDRVVDLVGLLLASARGPA